MSAVVKPAKVSRKGQITLPREVRAALGTDRVHIVLEHGQVRIEPSFDPGGALHRGRPGRTIPLKQERERAWAAVIRDTAAGRPIDRVRALIGSLESGVPDLTARSWGRTPRPRRRARD